MFGKVDERRIVRGSSLLRSDEEEWSWGIGGLKGWSLPVVKYSVDQLQRERSMGGWRQNRACHPFLFTATAAWESFSALLVDSVL